MSKRRSGLLVLEANGSRACVGIVTPKDLLYRVVAAGLRADHTSVSSVMTPQPDTMSPSDTVLDALRQLQGSGYRTVPVISSSGEPFGVLDILGLMQGALQSSGSSSAAQADRASTRTTASASAATESVVDSMADGSEAPEKAESETPSAPAGHTALDDADTSSLDGRAATWLRDVTNSASPIDAPNELSALASPSLRADWSGAQERLSTAT
eukprot:6128503-Prymnesium_polylepis.1